MIFPVGGPLFNIFYSIFRVFAHKIGLGDRNAAREAVTESYLVRCNEVFAVNHIGRVVSSSGVERVIDLARQTKLDNVGIICTHAEVS